MGRNRFYRQRISEQAASVDAKSFQEHLVNEIRSRREVPHEEAELIAQDALDYLFEQPGFQGFGRISFPAINGVDNHYHKSRENQAEKLVNLTIVADDDAEMLKSGGIELLQRARLARVIEEAYAQGSLLDYPRLCLLFPLSARAIRARLQKLWLQGAALTIAGMSRKTRAIFKGSRAVLAMERYLQGEPLQEILTDLAVSGQTFKRWWQQFNQEQVPEEFSNLKELHAGIKKPLAPVAGNREDFYHLLQTRHGYSPAAAEKFIMDLEETVKVLKKQLGTGQLIYSATLATEPPGKALSECRLVNTVLDYVTAKDWELVDKDSPKALKWERIMRLATQAYAQGATLSQNDISYLMSISVDAVQDCIKAHPQVILPTRGFVADMGPTLSHAEKIIALYMDGYTETEITRRTGHSYDSVSRYLIDFSKVVFLTEQGLPLPAVRQVLGFSRRMVEKYLALYHRFNVPEFFWRMGRIRRIATAHPVKKNEQRK